jgi:hypothetical protein
VSKVTNMGTMFYDAKAFSKTLCGAWQKSTANKDRMFSGSSGKITSMCTTPKGTKLTLPPPHTQYSARR